MGGGNKQNFNHKTPYTQNLTNEILNDKNSNLQISKNGTDLKIYSIPSGTKVFDWIVPDEWVVKDAYITLPNGKKICEFSKQNLHLLNYSTPFKGKITLQELKKHLYTNKNLPDAIPYVTSYYEKRWGFCLSQNEFDNLEDGIYEVFIDTDFKKNGELNYGEAKLFSTQGSNEWVIISTYLCHPQMTNNELSGPVVMSKLFSYIKSLPRKYNYLFVIVPETIGSICYINKNFDFLKKNIKAGFVLSCIGDNGDYSVILSPSEDKISDKVALHTINFLTDNPKIYSFLDRGSDERQYNTPNLDLGVVTLCRTKFGCYKEYHTSADDLNFVSEQGLQGGFTFIKNCIENLEINKIYKLTTTCEPNLGSRGLIPTINKGQYNFDTLLVRHFLAFCDGKNSVIDIANKLKVEARTLELIINKCLEFNLIKETNDTKYS